MPVYEAAIPKFTGGDGVVLRSADLTATVADQADDDVGTIFGGKTLPNLYDVELAGRGGASLPVVDDDTEAEPGGSGTVLLVVGGMLVAGGLGLALLLARRRRRK